MTPAAQVLLLDKQLQVVTDESLGILEACSSVASVTDGQCGFGNRYLLRWILAQGKEYPGIYFESDAQQMSGNLDTDSTHLLIQQVCESYLRLLPFFGSEMLWHLFFCLFF